MRLLNRCIFFHVSLVMLLLCLGLYQSPCPLSSKDFGKDTVFSPIPRNSLHSRELLQCGKDWLPRYCQIFFFLCFFSPVLFWSHNNYHQWFFFFFPNKMKNFKIQFLLQSIIGSDMTCIHTCICISLYKQSQ